MHISTIVHFGMVNDYFNARSSPYSAVIYVLQYENSTIER